MRFMRSRVGRVILGLVGLGILGIVAILVVAATPTRRPAKGDGRNTRDPIAELAAESAALIASIAIPAHDSLFAVASCPRSSCRYLNPTRGHPPSRCHRDFSHGTYVTPGWRQVSRCIRVDQY